MNPLPPTIKKDPDPGDPKTADTTGSGSETLILTVQDPCIFSLTSSFNNWVTKIFFSVDSYFLHFRIKLLSTGGFFTTIGVDKCLLILHNYLSFQQYTSIF